MATQATSSSPSSTFSSSSSSSSSCCPRWKYHVFLSFCGVDTRMNFTDHLYTALKQKSIITFRDDEKLERGKYISPELLKAIEESKYAIIVLSTNYAFSKWCFKELAKIVECKEKTGLTVLPVFYHVDPSDVRNQRGIFAEAFAKHEEDKVNTEDVQAWKAALKDVGHISGWHVHDSHESIVIQKIIARIFSELYHKLPCASEDLVGMDSCVEEILDSYLSEELGDVRLVGICGMGGMGKTTLAQEIYRRISDMGQEIIRRESPKEPGGRSRLWIYKDVIHVLKKNTGTEIVEGIMLNLPIQKVEHLSAEAFSKMKNLRLLKIGNEKFPQDFINGTMRLPKDLNRGKVQFPEGLSYLSNELRVIEWHGYHLKCLPTNFQPDKLVELRMHCSGIKQLWKGNLIFDELKLIDLSDSQNLIKTLDFSKVPNLKQLILQRCIRLSKIHASLGNLKWLTRLDLNGCKCLESLPPKINLESLEIFILSGCSRLKKFPEVVGNMSSLSELYLNETAIKELPLSVEHLTGLTKLDLGDCKNLSSLPNVCCCLMSLKILTLSGCSKINELPENLGNIKGLKELDVSETAIRELPSSFVFLKNLKVLSLRGCEGLSSASSNKLISFLLMRKRRVDPTGMLGHSLSNLWSLTELNLSYCNLQAIPECLGCLSSLTELDLRGNNFVCLPESTTRLSNMKILRLCGCTHLRSLPELPLNIEFIDANGCTSLKILPLRHEDGPYSCLCLLNCVKLINNEDYGDMLLTTLRHRIQFKGDEPIYDTIIPGREIPKWFRHQSVGTSVNLQVPSDKFEGVAVCAVFVLRQHHPLHQLPSGDDDDGSGYIVTHGLQWYLKANGDESKSKLGGFPFSEQFGKIESYNLFLKYYPYRSFNQELKENRSQVNANGLGQIEIGFETYGPGLEVTKCGVCWVYQQDIKDLNQTMHGCSSSNSCSITPYEDDLEDSAKKKTKTK
ncbi:hypothetical protein ACB098_12G175100 [Castanea mollissima]